MLFRSYMFLDAENLVAPKTPIISRLIDVVNAGIEAAEYNLRILRVLKLNPILNRIKKPKLTIHQIKEKYGRLVIYYTIDGSGNNTYVECRIAETELRLALKGAYYPVESLTGQEPYISLLKEMSPPKKEV